MSHAFALREGLRPRWTMNDPVIQEVMTGEVKVGTAGTLLSANALGSCVAVMALDLQRKAGGIAHVMLPGKAALNKVEHRLRYAEDAVDEMIGRLLADGSHIGDLTVCVAGGANVLERRDDIICGRNIAAVTQALLRKDIVIAARSVGGFRRRRVKLHIGQGCFFCAIGDGQEQLLWSPATGAVRLEEAV